MLYHWHGKVVMLTAMIFMSPVNTMAANVTTFSCHWWHGKAVMLTAMIVMSPVNTVAANVTTFSCHWWIFHCNHHCLMHTHGIFEIMLKNILGLHDMDLAFLINGILQVKWHRTHHCVSAGIPYGVGFVIMSMHHVFLFYRNNELSFVERKEMMILLSSLLFLFSLIS